MGSTYKTYLFSAEGEPKDLETATNIANTLSDAEISAMEFGISGMLFSAVNNPATKNRENLEASLAAKALFKLSWPEVVFTKCDLFFDAKDKAKCVYDYVLWARKDEILYVTPIIKSKEKKLLNL
jgi:hypothetical protein